MQVLSKIIQITQPSALVTFFQINDHFTVMRDFNDGTSDIYMEQFYGTYKLNKLITRTTHIKKIENVSSINLILKTIMNISKTRDFSDFHNLTYLVIKSCFFQTRTLNHKIQT